MLHSTVSRLAPDVVFLFRGLAAAAGDAGSVEPQVGEQLGTFAVLDELITWSVQAMAPQRIDLPAR